MDAKLDAPHWMGGILKEGRFRKILARVALTWRGVACEDMCFDTSFPWRLPYLKPDLERLLRSDFYSKTCKRFMLRVTAAEYLESKPGGLLMPDVSVFGSGRIPNARTESEFMLNLGLGAYDDVATETLRRVVMAGNSAFCDWLDRFATDEELAKVAMSLLVLRQSDRFAEIAVQYFNALYPRVMAGVKDSAGNGALWYARPHYRTYETNYIDYVTVHLICARRASLPQEAFAGFIRELTDMGCDPLAEGEYGLSFNDLDPVLGSKESVSFEFPDPSVDKELVSRYFWYVVEWSQWKANMGGTFLTDKGKEVLR